MKVQVTDACAPRVTASPFYTCRRHKRDFRPPRYRRPTAHSVRMVEAVELVACQVFIEKTIAPPGPGLRGAASCPAPAAIVESSIQRPPSPRAMGPQQVWTGRSRSRGPKRSPTDSVLLALLLHCACDGEDGARH